MINPMDKPHGAFANSPTSTGPQFPISIPDPSSFKQNFDQLLNNRGIHFMHYRSLPCPNMRWLDDNSHDPLCPHCDGSGIIYYSPKVIIGTFQSNSIEKQFEYQGEWEIGTATVTMPTEYPDGTQADFTLFDRLEIIDYTVRLWEKKEYEPRPGNLQQLRYPIQKVEFLITANPTTLKEFKEGVDFTIEDGKIKWVTGRSPGYNTIDEIGETFSTSYIAFPVYIVLQPLRELRVTQQMMPDGTKVSIRLPQQVVVKRDFLVNPSETLANPAK